MRVLAIAQRLTQRSGNRHPSRELLATPLGKPCRNCRVVGCRSSVRLAGETAAQRERGAAMSRQLIEHSRLLVWLDQHSDEFVVLGRRSDQCRPTNVDVLDARIV